MSIGKALASATSGLSAAALRASIASGNIANANSPGYVRRDLVVTERAGGGVAAIGVQRSQNEVVTADRRIAESSVNRAEAIADAHIRFSQAMGDPESDYGLFARYQDFEQALGDLAVSPESAVLQGALAGSARDLVAEFNALADLAADQRQGADAAIAAAVDTVNQALHDLKRLNVDLAGLSPTDESAAQLEDRRQQLLDEISRYVPIKTFDKDNGQTGVMTREGVVLLSGTSVQELSFTRTHTIAPGDSLAAGDLSGLRVGNVEITPGAGRTSSVQSGALAGYFEIRDSTAVTFQAQIDALAADLVSRFEDPGLDPTIGAGDAGLFTDAGGPFDPAHATGLAGRLALNTAVDPQGEGEIWRLRDGLYAGAPGAEGDATILSAMVDAVSERRTPLSGLGMGASLTTAEAIAEINATVGDIRTRSESALASARARADILYTAELEAGAVDTDQEMQTLLLVEQAYAANARVIQAVDTMMQRLLEI